MGNSESSNGHNTRQQRSSPTPSAPSARFNEDLGMVDVPDGFLEEQRRLYFEVQREQERRKAAEARARREQEIEMLREQRRLQLERQRVDEMIETRARQARELEKARREAAEARVRHEREQELEAMRERERLRLQAEARRAREKEEERRKTEEAKARQEREQEREAMRERERQRLEVEARRTREKEEVRRKAEEAKARQEQEGEAIRERERQRQEESKTQQLLTSLPQVCRPHTKRQGCSDPNCRRLHICRLFLADICKHGVTCRYGHSLTTVHNQIICSRHNLDTVRDLVSLQQLRRAFDETDELPQSMYVKSLERCFKFGCKNSCDDAECNRIHLCRQYVAGDCSRAVCRFGHDLHTTHNNRVLSRHRLTTMTDDQILNILREKETGGAQKANGAAAAASSTENGATATDSSAKNGAIPRQRSYGARNQTNQQRGKKGQEGVKSPAAAGLSEELQCPVCLEMFNRATTLGCGHTFCAGCLQEVRDRIADRCPLCRASITSVVRSVTLDNIIRSMTAKQ